MLSFLPTLPSSSLILSKLKVVTFNLSYHYVLSWTYKPKLGLFPSSSVLCDCEYHSALKPYSQLLPLAHTIIVP